VCFHPFNKLRNQLHGEPFLLRR